MPIHFKEAIGYRKRPSVLSWRLFGTIERFTVRFYWAFFLFLTTDINPILFVIDILSLPNPFQFLHGRMHPHWMGYFEFWRLDAICCSVSRSRLFIRPLDGWCGRFSFFPRALFEKEEKWCVIVGLATRKRNPLSRNGLFISSLPTGPERKARLITYVN